MILNLTQVRDNGKKTVPPPNIMAWRTIFKTLMLLSLGILVAECRSSQPSSNHFLKKLRYTSDPLSYAFHDDDEIVEGRKIYKNPRNAPSESCPRDEEAIARTGRTCLRKCSADADCLSRKKVCLCDGICGLSCIKPDKECGELDNPMFGYVDVKSRIVGSKAQYRCQEGYHLIGQEERQCQANGIWTFTPPECRENLYCTDPPVFANARHNGLTGQTRFEVNKTLKYTCYEGYITQGFDRAKCLLYNNTMQWFGPEIHCEPKVCGDPGEIENGFKEGSCFSFSCRVTYHCRPGFELVGRSSYHCQHDGTWNPKELPTCSPVQCEIPENPENGKAIFIAVSYNAVVSYECNYSYMIVGSSTRRCGPDKKWSGVQPQCKQINCGHPGHLSNGWLENIEQGTALGSSIIFRCFPNMTIEGDQSTVCQSDGTWSKPPPMCLAPCIVPSIESGIIKNNTRTGTQVPHGTVIDVQCNENYELTYSLAPSICYNGTWTHYPRCQAARCKSLPRRPRHGMVIAPKTDHGMRARYRCKDGYKLEGADMTECHYGNWTNITPYCREVYCPFPGELTNGRVLLVGNMGMYDYRSYVKKVRNNRQIRFSCNKGYYLVSGPPGATCVAGRWSPKELPSCVPDLHPRIHWIKRSVNISEYEESINQTSLEAPNSDIPGNEELREEVIDDDEDDKDDEDERDDEAESDDDENEEDDSNRNESTTMWPGLLSSAGTSSTPKDWFEFAHGNGSLPATPGTWAVIPLPTTSNTNALGWSNLPPSETNTDVLVGWSVIPSGMDDDSGLLYPQDNETSSLMVQSLRITEAAPPPPPPPHPLPSSSSSSFSFPVLFQSSAEAVNMSSFDAKEENGSESYEEEEEEDITPPHPSGTTPDFTKKERGPLVDFYRILRVGNSPNEFGDTGRWPSLKRVPRDTSEEKKEKKDKHKRRNKWKKKGKNVHHCDDIPNEQYLRVEVIRPGRDDNYTYSAGARIKVTCLHGYGLNIGNRTAKCAKGRWKPMKPECVTHPCVLPELSHGKYKSGYKKGLTIIHGAKVEYACDEGWFLNVTEVACYLGVLRPAPPACVVPGQATNIINSRDAAPVKRGGNIASYNDGDLTPGGDITILDRSVPKKSCRPPTKVNGTTMFKNGQILSERDDKFPDGTKVTFSCLTNNIGEKNSWEIVCSDGFWNGVKFPTSCGADGADDAKNNYDYPEEVDYGTKPCKWAKTEPNVVTFYNDQEVTEESVEFPAGSELVARCYDIGKYALVGNITRMCKDGTWTGQKPACFGLNQENDYSLDKPPTILFRHERGPMAQSNDGKLVVYPGTDVYLECLFRRRFGTPKWNVTLTSMFLKSKRRRKKGKAKGNKGSGKGKNIGNYVPYPNGWANAPNRDMQLEYRLSIYKAAEKDTGTYVCTTPYGHNHQVKVDVRSVHCNNTILEKSKEELAHLQYEPVNETKMSTIVRFTCEPGYSLVGSPTMKCMPSGEWSAPIPQCEKDKCVPPEPPLHGNITGKGPFHSGDIIEVTCEPNFILEHQHRMICQDDGQWSVKVPTCSQACTYPGTTISGTMSSVKYQYPINDNITYTCNPGFTLRGESTIFCKEGGQWSAPVPSCMPKP